MFWRGLTVAGSTMGTLTELQALCRLVDVARLKPVIDSVHRLARGKVVVETT